MYKPNFFILTGGPGVGKTALLAELARRGELTVAENARAVIADEMADEGEGMPWRDNRRFCDLTTARDIADFDRLSGETRRVFFDRGIIDMWGANGTPPSPALREAVRTRRYNETVFVLPPWREIYETDAERRQDWAEAEATFGRILAMLAETGYAPVVVPTGSVAARAEFVRGWGA
ncbi:AAA family ATPase [Phenylobacterium sp.]|uniref:AAA family ATPase n=1 Tax=Phenylobacterium sp. TaxID=1871053 RepID=UPI00301BE0FE